MADVASVSSYNKPDDVLKQNLMLSIDQEIRKEQRYKKTPQAEGYHALYRRFYFMKHVVLVLYVAMAFFEIPTWCLDREDIKDYVYCDYEIYPNSGLPKLPLLVSGLLEIWFLSILLFFTYFRRTFKIPSYNSKVREVVQTTLTIAAMLDIGLAMIMSRGTFFSKFIRVALIVVFIRSLRESLKRIALVVYDSKEIMMLLVSYILFFGWIATRLFRGTQEGEKYFPNLSEGCWSLLILLTTANFPDIMLPAYHTHKAY